MHGKRRVHTNHDRGESIHGGVAVYLLGHLGAAAAAYVLVRRGVFGRRASGPSPALAGLLVLAMAPDIDHRVPGLEHRGFTHSVWFAALLGVAVALVAVTVAGSPSRSSSSLRLPRRAAARGFAVGAGAVLVHLAADAVTPMGVRPLAPLSDAGGSFSLVSAADPRANAAMFAAGVALVCADRWGAAAGRTAPIRRLRRALRPRLPTVRKRA